MKNLKFKLTALVCALSLESFGATLSLKDGSQLEGDVVKVSNGVMHFKTGFAGTLEIPQSAILGIVSEEAISLRTASGEVFNGKVASLEEGRLTVRSGAGTVETRVSEIESAWQAGDQDPIQAEREAALAGQLRKWSYEMGIDVSGSNGNSENLSTGLRFEAKLEGPDDRLRFYGSYLYSQTDDLRSEDEQKGGVSYTNFFSEKMGWYVRQELERDWAERIALRSTTAGGLSYRFINETDLSLEGRMGVSYRFEDYMNAADSEDFPGLDVGLNLGWKFAEWGRLTSSLTYNPSFADFAEYLLIHESGVDIPLAVSNAWKLRLGVSNQYNSMPEGGREKLDTTYFVRLILSWD